MPVSIRLVELSEVDRLFQVRTSVSENLFTLVEMAAIGITPVSVAAMIRHSPCAWAAIEEGEIVGFSMIDDEEATVSALFVQPSHQGKGIGKKLLQVAEEALFQQHGVIWLETGKTTRAVGFYRYLGWENEKDNDGKYLRFEKRRA